jgi:alkylglycerol monooxygenase
VPREAGQVFWTSLPGWLLALVFYDFCYYWLHRLGHECAVLWAAHVVHHQSQDYNLSTALRQTSSGALLGWVFYLPMAVAGVPPLVFGVVALIDLLYQFWVHTEQVGRLGWFDRWYLDKNYGGILMLWDRWFGTFKDEDDAVPCVYGTRSALNSWSPLWANAEVYWALAQDSWRTARWADKCRVWLKPPGWRPADVAAQWPRAPFDLAAVRTYDTSVSRGTRWVATILFVAMLSAATALLWSSHAFSLAQNLGLACGITAGLWLVCALLQGRMRLSSGE